MTAKEISRLLIECHRKRGWRADVEFRFHPRRLDVLAISQNGQDVVGYEIKVSVEDFRSEMRNDAKRRASQDYCTEFYYVVPFGLIVAKDVPLDCGLLYCNYDYFVMVKRAPSEHKRTLPPEIELLLSTFHKLIEQNHCNGSEETPRWMLSPSHRPLRFQFDVAAVASKMAVVYSQSQVDFDGVPF